MIATTGFFDGVHLGHRLVIERLVFLAHERGDESLVVTFWPHPRAVLQDGARELRLLTTLEEKKTLLSGLGVSRIEVLDFTRSFAALSAPPPAQTTVPNFSMWVGWPNGPTMSVMYSPTFRSQSFEDERPTFCTTSVIVPAFVSASAMVSGIRSPFSPILIITKWPALRDCAIRGASTTILNTFSEYCSLLPLKV